MNQLPSNWITVSINDVAEYISRGKSPKYTDHSILPVINQKAIRWFGIEDRYLKYVHPDQIKEWTEERFIRDGDILWNSTGRGTLGRACLIYPQHLVPPKVVDSHVTLVRPYKDAIDPRYLFAWIRSPYIQDNLESLATGATNQIELSRAVIAQMELPLAPLNEQKRITGKLDAFLARLDSCQSHLERVPHTLKSFRQSVLAAATSGQLTEVWRSRKGYADKTIHFDFPDANCFGDYEFPTAWQVMRLRDIADVKGGITKDSKKQDLADKEFPYLRVANVQRGYFDLNEIKTIRVPKQRVKDLLLKDGDILFNEGGDIDKLGRGWVWSGEIKRCVFQNHVFRARLREPDFVPKYFSHYGNSRGYDYFLQYGKQTTNLASINKTILESLPIAVPPADEQREIVRRIANLFALADRLEARYQSVIEQVGKLTSSLLAKAFRGELVEQDPNDEPAEKLLQRMIEIRKIEEEKIKTEPRKKKEKKMRTKAQRKSLHETLLGAGTRLTPEDLFAQAGFDVNSIDEFYEELRTELKKKRIEEIRQGTEKVYLKGVSK